MAAPSRAPDEFDDPGLRMVVRELDKRRKIGMQLSSRSELASALGRTRQCISMWTRIPVEHCEAIHELLGIEPHKLRPDIFKRPRKTKGAA